jgi:hypothetical protein
MMYGVYLLLLAVVGTLGNKATSGGELVTGREEGDTMVWLTNAAGNRLAEDFVTTVVSVGCENVPWSSPHEEEMASFAASYVTDQEADFKLHTRPRITLLPANELTLEMKMKNGVFTNGKGKVWSKWSLKCPVTSTQPCRLPPHSHVIVFVYIFKYTDVAPTFDSAFERVIVVIEGKAPVITHWQKNVPTNVECHRELSRITRFSQSSRNKLFFHANNVCGGTLDVHNTASWSSAGCPNQGIYLLGWTAANEFQIHSTKHSTVSVRDDLHPTVDAGKTRTICIIDEKHQANTPNAPKLCLARLVDYYARTEIASDNCDDWDELDILVESRERVICDGKGDGNTKEDDDGTKPVGSDPPKCRRVEETMEEMLESGHERSTPYHPYHERCTAPPDASVTRYMLKIGDICHNYHPTLVDFTVHYVGSWSVCPVGAFIVYSSTEHLQER